MIRIPVYRVSFCLQSYLATVPHSVISCASETALDKFHELESRFDSENVPGVPWAHVDTFGQGTFYKTLLAAYKCQCDAVSKVEVVCSRSASVINAGSGSSFRSPGKTTKLVHEGAIPASEVAKTVNELRGRASNH